MSCAGNGYLTGKMLIPFPFEDGQCIEWPEPFDRGVAQRLLESCFVDAEMCFRGNELPEGRWPSLGEFSVSGSTLSFQIMAGHAAERLSVSWSSDRFPIANGLAPWGHYVMVLSSEGIRNMCESGISPPAPGYSSSSEQDGGNWLRLCDRCITLSPVGLTSIRVYDGVRPDAFSTSTKGYFIGDTCYRNGKYYVCVSRIYKGEPWDPVKWDRVSLMDVKRRNPSFILDGEVSIKPGNNMQLSEPDVDNGIGLEAIPGAGLGPVTCWCDDLDAKAAKSPIFSPDGHTRIFNDTCYDLEPGEIGEIQVGNVSRVSRKLLMHAKCTACCTCEMYGSIVNDRLAPLASAIREARASMYECLDKYESSVKMFNGRISKPHMSDVILTLSGMPVGVNLGSKLSGGSVKGKMGRCAFTAMLRNSSYRDVTATIYALSGTDKVVEASASWTDASGSVLSKTYDSASAVTRQRFTVASGGSMALAFVSVRDAMSGSVDGSAKYRGDISVGLSYKGENGAEESIGTIDKSVEV